jgi:hypothetical protein
VQMRPHAHRLCLCPLFTRTLHCAFRGNAGNSCHPTLVTGRTSWDYSSHSTSIKLPLPQSHQSSVRFPNALRGTRPPTFLGSICPFWLEYSRVSSPLVCHTCSQHHLLYEALPDLRLSCPSHSSVFSIPCPLLLGKQ